MWSQEEEVREGGEEEMVVVVVKKQVCEEAVTGKREMHGGGESKGVDEGEMEGLKLLLWLHTVDFFFFFLFQVLSVLFTKPTDLTRERERERES